MVGNINKEIEAKTQTFADILKVIESSSKNLRNKSQSITEVLFSGRQSIKGIQNSLVSFQISTGESLDYVSEKKKIHRIEKKE